MTEIVNRKNTKCLKWDLMEFIGGSKDDIPMWIADMDYACESRVIEAMKKRLEHPAFGYTFQTPGYRQAISSWYERRHQVQTNPDWIVPCLNVLGAMQLIADAFLHPGDNVMMFTPIYPQFYGIISAANAKPEEYQLFGCESVDWDKAEKHIALSRVVIFCNPHNPLARVWTKEECRKLAELCAKYNVLLLSDEVHGDMAMFGHTYHSMEEFEEIKDHLVVFTSAAKTFNLAGLGGAALIIPNKGLRKKIKQILERYYQCEINALTAEGIEAAYRYGDKWLDDTKKYLEDNVSLVMKYINEKMPKLRCEHQATFLMWIDVRGLERADLNIAELLKTQSHILLDDGRRYGKTGEGFIRANIACSREDLKAAMEGFVRLYSDIENRKY